MFKHEMFSLLGSSLTGKRQSLLLGNSAKANFVGHNAFKVTGSEWHV